MGVEKLLDKFSKILFLEEKINFSKDQLRELKNEILEEYKRNNKLNDWYFGNFYDDFYFQSFISITNIKLVNDNLIFDIHSYLGRIDDEGNEQTGAHFRKDNNYIIENFTINVLEEKEIRLMNDYNPDDIRAWEFIVPFINKKLREPGCFDYFDSILENDETIINKINFPNNLKKENCLEGINFYLNEILLMDDPFTYDGLSKKEYDLFINKWNLVKIKAHFTQEEHLQFENLISFSKWVNKFINNNEFVIVSSIQTYKNLGKILSAYDIDTIGALDEINDTELKDTNDIRTCFYNMLIDIITNNDFELLEEFKLGIENDLNEFKPQSQNQGGQ